MLKVAADNTSFVALARFVRQAERVRTHRVKPGNTKSAAVAKPAVSASEAGKTEAGRPAPAPAKSAPAGPREWDFARRFPARPLLAAVEWSG